MSDRWDAAARRVAEELTQIDVAVYQEHGADPLEPIFGAGPALARLCLFGRDPGREEVRHRVPFIGAGGMKIRQGLGRARWGREPEGLDEALAVGDAVYWANTVPYKPVGNKAWAAGAVRAMAPLVAERLVEEWRGREVITLGQVAFLWFGHQDRSTKAALQAHWAREDRFETSIEVALRSPSGAAASLRLSPLPHPSPLNAVWFNRFPGLLDRRLSEIASSGWTLAQGEGRGGVSRCGAR
ncbi:MAG: uracil-DNA glycosylase [Deltaproteobacteria bacterium]|nr:uracil-DNA glycosylase [Deltaproteobacteria bacterium]